MIIIIINHNESQLSIFFFTIIGRYSVALKKPRHWLFHDPLVIKHGWKIPWNWRFLAGKIIYQWRLISLGKSLVSMIHFPLPCLMTPEGIPTFGHVTGPLERGKHVSQRAKTGWGWLEHDCYVSIHLGIIIIPTDELIFFRGVGFNHQPDKQLEVWLPSGNLT